MTARWQPWNLLAAAGVALVLAGGVALALAAYDQGPLVNAGKADRAGEKVGDKMKDIAK